MLSGMNACPSDAKSQRDAATYLDNSRTRASRDYGSGRAHVEGVMPITARANNVHHEVTLRILYCCFQRSLPENIRRRRQGVWSPFDSIDMQSGQEGANLDRVNGVGSEDVVTRLFAHIGQCRWILLAYLSCSLLSVVVRVVEDQNVAL